MSNLAPRLVVSRGATGDVHVFLCPRGCTPHTPLRLRTPVGPLIIANTHNYKCVITFPVALWSPA